MRRSTPAATPFESLFLKVGRRRLSAPARALDCFKTMSRKKKKNRTESSCLWDPGDCERRQLPQAGHEGRENKAGEKVMVKQGGLPGSAWIGSDQLGGIVWGSPPPRSPPPPPRVPHVPRPLTWRRKALRRQRGSGEPGWRAAAADPTGVPSRFLSPFLSVSVGEQVAVEALALMSPGCCCCCLLPSPMQEAEAKAGR